MIKFWKNASKGKSGCPVRPPERSVNVNSGYTLQTINEDEDTTEIFQKQSRLSPSLQNILTNDNSVKYFIQYMESIGMIIFIKCWLEIENFKIIILKHSRYKSDDNHLKIHRTKSFDTNINSSSSINNQLKRTYSCKIDICDLFDTPTFKNLPNVCHKSQNVECNDFDSKNEYVTNVAEEAVKLFKKYVALEAPSKLDLPDDVRKVIISNICQPEGNIQEDCFKLVQDIVFHEMEIHFESFQKNHLYLKAQIDVLTNSSLTLGDILYNNTILFYFTEYLEQESCCTLLEFLIAIVLFRDNLISNSAPGPEQAQNDAIIIYQKYVSLQATSPIGFSTEVRLKVEEDICREGGPLYSCFDLPYQIVYKTVENYVITFLQSEIYYKYLSEMINSIDNCWQSHKKTHSDCSSEISISTQNTLLAMGDQSFKKKKGNTSVPDMTIDSNQLYNADSLWQRKRQDGLNLGRVNSLGRFESKFEPDPDIKQKSALKKMFNKFMVHTSQVEEEMAWQIAHMIVKEITNLTMASPDSVS